MLASLALGAACSSDSATAIPPTATTLTLVSGNQQTAVVANLLPSPIVLKLADQYGNPVAGAPFTFTESSGGNVSVTNATTDATGVLSVMFTLGTASGVDTLTAVSSGLATTIVATAKPDAIASIVVVSGDSQSAAAGSTLGAPVTVKVTDQYGNPIAGAVVQWTDDANGTFASPTVVSDANGLATNTYTLGPTPGTEDISVQVTTPNKIVSATIVEIGG